MSEPVLVLPHCAKCSKTLAKHPQATWNNGWSCDWPKHVGANRFTTKDNVFGCPTVKQCNWGMCKACYTSFLVEQNRNEIPGIPKCGKCSKTTLPHPPRTWGEFGNWGCDGPNHVGANSFSTNTVVYGCPTVMACNWGLCATCWKKGTTAVATVPAAAAAAEKVSAAPATATAGASAEVPCCKKCSKSMKSHPGGTWNTGWSCDWPAHQGANRFNTNDPLFGCSTIKACNWGMCQACWNKVTAATESSTTAAAPAPVTMTAPVSANATSSTDESPCCGKCSKAMTAKPARTWNDGWGCDWPTHEGSNRFKTTDALYGCPTIKACNWGMCQACWTKFSASKSAAKAATVASTANSAQDFVKTVAAATAQMSLNDPLPPAAAPAPDTAAPPVTAPMPAPAAAPEPAKRDDKQLLMQALQHGSKKWRRSKYSILGQGRAGKTAFANAIVGKVFSETSSTVGINQLTCDVKHVQVGDGAAGADGEAGHQWGECCKAEREFECALADMIASNMRREAQQTAAVASTTVTAPTVTEAPQNIVEYMQNLQHFDTEPATGPSAGTLAADPMKKADSVENSVKLPATVQPPPPKVEEVAAAVDEEMVMKTLATMQDRESGLLISLFDFGGQSVFDVIHHLFLTRNGVYALVFNMEWLLHDGPEKDKALRFMRNWLSSIAIHTYDKTTMMTAPIVIVGTRLDLVPSAAAHEVISTVLYEAFSDNLAWRSVLENENGRDSNGKAFQWFYPVDNKLGQKCHTMKDLMSVVHKSIDSAAYTHKEVPLSWFRVMDCMDDAGRDCLALAEVAVIGARCGVHDAELTLLLTFLHDMGHLMWHNEPELRDVVILDPISYLVTPATIIICKLTPDKDDTTHHFMPSHRECSKMHKKEWTQLKQDGVLDTKLLPILWKEYADHTAVLLLLMVKFGLLVPLRSAAPSTGNSSSGPGPVSQYLVPTLLSPTPLGDPTISSWTEEPYTSCYFVFTLAEDLALKSNIILDDLKSAGFLPGGLFERIIGKALTWSQETAKGASISLQSVMLFKDMAVLSFGRQRFRLVHCADIHCVRVDIEGKNPIAVQQKLVDFITKIMDECLKSLCCFTAVCHKTVEDEDAVSHSAEDPLHKHLSPMELLIPLSQLRNAAKGESILTWRGGKSLMSPVVIKAKYAAWLQQYDLREHYDVFISYRWGRFDSDFTEALFDMLTNFSVGDDMRAVEVFLDSKRLQDGRKFKHDFAAALTHSLIAVPVVSVDALQRMADHSPEFVDNVLLEWIMILEASAAKRVQKVFPVLFGVRTQANAIPQQNGANQGAYLPAGGLKVKDFFSDRTKDNLPHTVPAATLAQAAELLANNNITPSAKFSSYTVHSIVQELLQFLLFKASDISSFQLVETFAGKVVTLLGDCGAAALAQVAQPAQSAVAVLVADPVYPHSERISPPIEMPAADQRASPVPNSSTAAGAGTRPLKSLSVEEVGALMEHCGFKKLRAIFADNEVSGNMLWCCEEVADLQSEDYGVTNKAIARGLLELIIDWKAQGVPNF